MTDSRRFELLVPDERSPERSREALAQRVLPPTLGSHREAAHHYPDPDLVDSGSVEPTPWQVFLSSTIKDFLDYRREVQEVLLKRAEAIVFLSEDWPNSYDDIVQKCRSRIESSNGFLLMMGHWYGSIPPGYEKSITHLEFEWAAGKWRKLHRPPIAVFVPTPQSKADRKLRSAADRVFAENKVDVRQHSSLLGRFKKQVMDSWRAVRHFEDQHDLRECALAVCLFWRGRTPLAAARGNVDVSSSASRLTDEQLGRLGRQRQLTDVKEIVARLEASPGVLAVCLLISGKEDCGHRVFVSALLRTQLFRAYRPTRLCRPAFERYDTELIIQWAAKSLGFLPRDEWATPQDLAELVIEGLKEQPLCLALDQVNRFQGGISAFREEFWRPFYDRLRELGTTYPIRHRFVMIVTEYGAEASEKPESPSEPTSADKSPSFSQFALLQPLSNFTSDDLIIWLADLEVPGDLRLAVAESVLRDAEGSPDSSPLRVFDRLQRETLWPLPEEENE